MCSRIFLEFQSSELFVNAKMQKNAFIFNEKLLSLKEQLWSFFISFFRNFLSISLRKSAKENLPL